MEHVCLLGAFDTSQAQFGNVFHHFLAPTIFHLEKILALFDELSICVNLPPDFEKWKANSNTYPLWNLQKICSFVGFFVLFFVVFSLNI